MLLTWMNRVMFATFIPAPARIGKNFTVGYWGLGIVIHTKTQIGDNCWIGQNVTIGRKGGDVGVPVIGNNVYIATGTVVVGEITVGDNCIIGANSFVSKSIPPCSLAFGSPAKVTRSITPAEWNELTKHK
jgi:serine O-acetyltransferase